MKILGLDCGTMNMIAALYSDDGSQIVTRRLRDAFVKLTEDQSKLISLGGMPHIKTDDGAIILGDDAVVVAGSFSARNKDSIALRRPLARGTVNPKEDDAQAVLMEIIHRLIGQTEDGVCIYSIPAPPVDLESDSDYNEAQDTVIYHEKILKKIIKRSGWKAIAANEGEALVFAECKDTGYTGLGISFGSGMTNFALVYKGLPIAKVAISRGGDYLDQFVSKRSKLSQTQALKLKEKGIDLMNPKSREEETYAFAYEQLIEHGLEYLAEELEEKNSIGEVDFPETIPIILGGGTSLATGFKDLFIQVLEEQTNFPFSSDDVRLAKDQLNAVAKGLLLKAKVHVESL